MNRSAFLSIVMVVGLAAIAVKGNPVRNGSFEQGDHAGMPFNWYFVISKGAVASVKMVDSQSSDGSKALLIDNKSMHQPNVYAMVYQPVKLQTGRRYRLSCRAKRLQDSDLRFVNGKRWQTRFCIKADTEWTPNEFEFTVAPEDVESDGSYMIRLSTEGLTSALVDDIAIEPVGPEKVNGDNAQAKRIYLLPEVNLDLKTLSAIPANMPKLKLPAGGVFMTTGKMPSRGDLSAEIALGYDAKGLIFLASVNDSGTMAMTGTELWNGDGIQLRIDQEGLLRNGEKSSDAEFGFSPGRNGVNTWFWQQIRELTPEDADVCGHRRNDGYFIGVRLYWSLLDKIDFAARKPFSFNVIVNDLDAGVSRRVAFLAPGIHDTKSSDKNTIALFKTGKPAINIFPTSLQSMKKINGRIVLSGVSLSQPAELKASLVDGHKNRQTVSLGPVPPLTPDDAVVAGFTLPLEKVAEGKIDLQVALGDMITAGMMFSKIDLGKQQLQALDKVDRDLAAVEAVLKKRYPDGGRSRYLVLMTGEIRRQSGMQRDDLCRKESAEARSFYVGRGEIVVPELQESMTRLQQIMTRSLPPTWMYVSSPSTLKEGWFEAEATDEQGNRERRKTFFGGYGHFQDVIRDLPYFQKIGANVIQIEIGPNSVLKTIGADGKWIVSTRGFDEKIVPALKLAWENNVQICLLLAPHYFPADLVKKYPEAKSSSGWNHYEVNHPRSREMIKAYLDALIPMLKNCQYREALHSLVLSNEPTYRGCNLDSAFSRQQFQEYLTGKFGSLAGFNRAAGTDFADFAALCKAGDQAAVKYEFNSFKRAAFAGWHRWMAEIIHRQWPEIPLSVKIMVFRELTPINIEHGIDVEQFAELSDLNGNDNYFNHGGNWAIMAMHHDLQLSLKKVSVCNSENHLIMDRESNAIPYDHIYAATFQQFMHGVGSFMTWVWSDLNYALRDKPWCLDLQGNIYRRPANVIAQGMAMLDANRIADPIVRFCQYDPAVALFYSPTAFIAEPNKYGSITERLYMHLSYTGYKLGFRSENQLARGDFGNVKVLVIPAAANIRRDALEGLRKFVDQGGRLVTYDECLQRDEYGRPLNAGLPAAVISTRLTRQKLTDALRNAVAQSVILPVKLDGGDTGTQGVVWRTVPLKDHGAMINLVNYNTSPRKIRLTVPDGMKMTDLVSGREVGTAFELPPLRPMLLTLKSERK